MNEVYSIGKLAKISNITVRTLRYYDEIGLLNPSNKTAGGHRYYTDQDITKLQQIITLKELGLQLETIQEFIKNKEMELRELLQLRLKMIRVEREKIDQMERTILSLLDLAYLEKNTNWEDLIEVFHSYKMTNGDIKRLRDEYFLNEEQEILNDLPNIGDGSSQMDEWVQLIKDIHTNIEEAPNSDISQQLARRWIALVNDMYRGNKQLAQKVWKSLKYDAKEFGFYQFDHKVIQFIEKAMNFHYESSKEENNEENSRA